MLIQEGKVGPLHTKKVLWIRHSIVLQRLDEFYNLVDFRRLDVFC